MGNSDRPRDVEPLHHPPSLLLCPLYEGIIDIFSFPIYCCVPISFSYFSYFFFPRLKEAGRRLMLELNFSRWIHSFVSKFSDNFWKLSTFYSLTEGFDSCAILPLHQESCEHLPTLQIEVAFLNIS